MKSINAVSIFKGFVILLSVFIISCASKKTGEEKKESSEHKIVDTKFSAVNFDAISDGIRVSDDSTSISTTGNSGWIEYTIVVPKAGRYAFKIIAMTMETEASVWVEDYIDNKDDRTYNVTGRIDVNSEGTFKEYSKIGSPFNAGKHKIRFHIDGQLTLRNFELELLRKHQPSSLILTQDMSGSEYELTWSDEFDEGEMPDTSKWTYDLGNWGWGNSELQYYTENRSENARIEDGNLIITALKDDMGEAWTSARLTTRGKVAFEYGKIEFRAKVPKEKGNWAAGWTLGNDYVDELSWPYCGEIDILESVGYEMDDETGNGKAHASAHCAAYYFKLGNQPTGILDVENMNEAFHTYAVEWTPDGMQASVDDEIYFEYNDTSTELSWPFSKAQNIILNLTMGGGWGGQKGMDSTVTKQEFIIDYVRVYQKK